MKKQSMKKRLDVLEARLHKEELKKKRAVLKKAENRYQGADGVFSNILAVLIIIGIGAFFLLEIWVPLLMPFVYIAGVLVEYESNEAKNEYHRLKKKLKRDY